MFRRLSLFLLSAAVLASSNLGAPSQTTAEVDQDVLKSAGLGTDNEALLQFFRQRTIKDEDRKALEQLTSQLDAPTYQERKEASDRLIQRGPAVVPFLKAALAGKPPLELRRRAEDCLRKIETTQGYDTVAAAARLLAARKSPEGVNVLLAYLPTVDDAWLEEEVLTSLGRLAVRGDNVAPRLLQALDDPLPARRAAALYVLGRRGDAAQRTAIRAALDHPSELVRQRAAQGLFGKRPGQAVADNAPADDALLKNNNVPLTEQGVLDFFRKRTLSEDDQARLARHVKDLGSLSYIERHVAAQMLVKEGTPALGFLKVAEYDPDAEVSRRAQRCIEEIRRGPGPALPIAAARFLARPTSLKGQPTTAAVQALLAYTPFVDDETVEDEVLTTLTLLSLQDPKLDPALAAALADPQPARRAAAAYVLGHVGTGEHVAPVRKLLDDAAPGVRLRAAQGLLAAKDRAAVPQLIALLAEASPAQLWRLEETLGRLAGEKAPAVAAGATPAARKAALAAWEKWWQEQGDSVDLARANESENYLGLVTVVEYDSLNGGRLTGQVWEAPRNGPPRWKIANLVGAMDAHVLPNGRVLVAENSANRVTERDPSGEVRWEYTVTGGNPICCQRLANGNTFIAMYNQLLEVRPDKTEVYRYSPGPQFYIFSAQKTRAGNVVCMTAQGTLIEVDPVAKKQLRTINLGFPAGGWCSVESLPNGRYLVATMNNNTIREVDVDGKTHWSASYPGVFRATRLPSGNVLAVSMTTRKVAELDRNGTERWSRVCEGRPWNVHYR